MGKIQNWECLFVHRKQGLFLSVYVDDIKMTGKKQTMALMWKKLMKIVDLDRPTSFLDHVYLGCTQRECKENEKVIDQHRAMFESRIYAGATEKLPYQGVKNLTQRRSRGPAIWKDMPKNALRYCELAIKQTEQLSVGELSKVCSQIVLKCSQLARIGRLDILWSVNKLARSVTKWTGTCDRRLARLIANIHHTGDYRQYYYVGNTAQHCRLGVSQDSDFACDSEDSKSISGEILCIFGSRTLVTISWMCNRQTSESHTNQKLFRWMLV